jgi:hypothetical protein
MQQYFCTWGFMVSLSAYTIEQKFDFVMLMERGDQLFGGRGMASADLRDALVGFGPGVMRDGAHRLPFREAGRERPVRTQFA